MPVIERWTMIRRRDWAHDHGAVIAFGAPVPEPDDELEVFEVVRAADVECIDAWAHAAKVGPLEAEVERLRAAITAHHDVALRRGVQSHDRALWRAARRFGHDNSDADDTIVLRLTPAEFWTLYFDAGGPIGPWPPPEGMVSHAARESYKVKLGYASAPPDAR